MINIKKDLEKIIKEALVDLGIEADEIHLEHPADLSMGDYSTNVAMIYANKVGQNPRELAEKITEKINLERGVLSWVEKVEVAGPGFINFFLTKKFFTNEIAEILNKGDKFGENDLLKGKKVVVEHSSPNLFKKFHIGHMANNSIGESVSRIIKSFGADVTNISYPSDVGLGIAQAIWAIKEKGTDVLFSDATLEEKIDFLGKAYSHGKQIYKVNEEMQKEVGVINKQVYEKSNDEINKIYNAGKEVTLKYFENIIERLGSKFDDYIFEGEVASVGKDLVEENLGAVFEESNHALVFKGEEYGLHTRVFVNSSGLPIYEAKDLGLMKVKFDRYNPDISIFVTDHEQGEYMKVVLKAAELINPIWSERTKHLLHGRLRFPHGRLSSREGGALTANDLLDQVKEVVLEKMNQSERGVENKEDVAEKMAVGAIKYFILKTSAGKNIVFDLESALSIEGNSAPYLQYTYARALSVANKAKTENIPTWTSDVQVEGEISVLEKMVYKFPEVVERAGKDYEPHHICVYLFDLAQAFNNYYSHNQIVNKEDESSAYKVALTEATAQVIKKGLYLLGIESPERI